MTDEYSCIPLDELTPADKAKLENRHRWMNGEQQKEVPDEDEPEGADPE